MEKYILSSFKKIYGEETIDDIIRRMQNELIDSGYSITVDKDYLLYILEIAILENCDVDDTKIETVINRMGNRYIPKTDFKDILIIHKNSINLIKKYLEKLK